MNRPPASFYVEELHRIGRADHPPEYVLASVSDMAVDALDRLIVLDRGDYRVKVYSPDGRFIRSYGGEGQGPGEMVSPQRLAVTPNGDIYIFDSNYRLLAFDSTGQHMFTRRVLPGIGVVTGFLVAPDSSVFVSGLIPFLGDRGIVHELTPQLEYRTSFGKRRSFDNPSAERLLGPSFAGGRLAIAPDGSLWFSQINPYLLRKFDPSGDEVREIHRPNDFMFPLEKAFRQQSRGDGTRFRVGAFAHSVALLVLPNGTIMNQVYDEPNERYIYDFFNSHGTFLGGVATYSNTIFSAYDSDLNLYSYVIEEYPQIVKYRLLEAP